jgi:hypothetical protein
MTLSEILRIQMSDRERLLNAEAAVLDRERRLLNLASIIRALTKSGAAIPTNCTVDYTITPEEARVLGIQNWKAAVEPQRASG